MKKYWNRLLAMLLAVLMAFSTLPALAMGADAPTATADHVVINQAYGGGGNSGADYKNDFIELYNPTDVPVSLEGWTIQYTSKGGTSYNGNITTLSGNISPHGYYLIQEAAGKGGTIDLPTPDASGSIAMNASEFKLALVSNAEPITGSKDPDVVDFLGVGGAGEYETKPTPSASNTEGVCRVIDGVDTDNNFADFKVTAPNPRSSTGNAGGTDPTQPSTTPPEEPTTTPTPPPSTGDSTWVKVTEDPGDWSGTYLIVYEKDGEAYIFNGNAGANNFITEPIADSTIITDMSYAIAISQTDGGYLLKRVSDGQYIYQTSEKTSDFLFGDIGAAVNNPFTIIMTNGIPEITENNAVSIQFNASSPRFKLYTSKQQAVSLYRLAGSTTPTTNTYVIWNPNYNVAMSSEKTGYYHNAVPVTNDGRKLAGYSNAEIWTIEDAGEGKVTISYDGKKIGVDDSYTSINWESSSVTHTEWILEPVEGKEGVYNIRNDTRELRIEYSSYNNFDANNKSFGSAPERYQFILTPAVPTATPPVNPDPVESTTPSPSEDLYLPKDGEKVVIYNPSSGKVLTGTASGKKLAGADATASAGKLTTDGTHLVLTVHVTGEGDTAVYTFKDDDGNLLTSGPTGNSLSLDPASADAAQEWTLTKTETGFVIVSTTAEYTGKNGTSKQALEYYTDGFTTFSVNASDSKFIMLFYPAANVVENSPTEPVDPSAAPKDGDKVVIYNPGSGAVLTGTVSDGKLAGAGATVSGEMLIAGSAPLVLTVHVTGEGEAAVYTFTDADGKILNTKATGNNLNLVTAGSADAIAYEWTLTKADNGFSIISTTAKYNGKDQALEYYNGNFTTYNVNTSDSKYIMQFYPAANVEVKPAEPEPPVEPEDSGYLPQNGDRVVIFSPDAQKVLTGTTTGKNLKGISATAGGGKLFAEATPLILTVGVSGTDGNAIYTFTTPDGKLLGTKSSINTIALVDPATAGDVATTWKVNAVSGGYIIVSATASMALEVYSGNFTTYYDGSDAAYVMQFYLESQLAKDLPTDDEIVDTIAQWGGGGPYSEAQSKEVKGDLYKTGDMLDGNATFTVKANGSDAKPYQQTKGSGSTDENPNYNYYMGGEKIGAKEGDYMQFALSTKGYGDMTFTFRTRVTGAGAKDYQVQYSTDGKNFTNFEKGSFSYSYHNYTSGEDVSKSGNIENGLVSVTVAKQYMTFTLDVPAGAENADNLLIRLVPGTAKISGTGTIDGNVRIDSVKLVGSPINDPSVPGYVTAEPNGQDEDVPAGTTIQLTPSNSGATVMYRFVDLNGEPRGDWATGNTTTLPENLPVALEIKAVQNGIEGPVRRLVFQAGTVESVKMNPNGGGIVFTNSSSAQILLSCATEGATIWHRTSAMKEDKDGDGQVDYVQYTDPIEVLKGFGSLTVEAYATKSGLANSSVTSRTFTEREKDRYDLYFGQMHSHTGFSDGTEDPAAAYAHADGLGEEWNMDFLAVTDHSNSFDNAGGTRTINDDVAGEWTIGHDNAKTATNNYFVGIFGYEMTWSNGLGHINTFNTDGFQDRTQSAYTTYSTALQNYYAELKNAPASISQFNHPGTTFGDFSDFSYYDPEIDDLITLIEVGNGEGAIGSSGYFPSYEYYTRALDKGWHLAPTNNQDNHKGHWGDANNGRDVVLVDELTQDAIYDAMRNYRVYATEDLNLEIYYKFDGQLMGTILTPSDVGDTALITVDLNDPDERDHGEATVEVIVNGGRVAGKATSKLNHETVTIEVPTTYNYYYIKVTQADGDIAVTAPVWVGEVEAIGVSSFTAQESLTVAGEEQTFNLSLYNNEKKTLTVNSIVITDKATGATLATLTDISKVKSMGTADTSFPYTFPTDGIYTLTATVNGVLNGVEKTYTQDLEVTVMPGTLVTNIIVDGTHYNDYVTGYYGGNMSNMTAIAANNAIKVTVVGPGKTITPEMLQNCSLLVLSAPARKDGTANAGDYFPSLYSDSFIAMVREYVQNGGAVVVAGLADYQDKGASSANYHAAAQQTALLEAIGSTMKIHDDEICDDTHNGGQNYRLYPETFNMDDPIAAPWLKGMVTAKDVAAGEAYQTYSQYSGCSVDPGNGTWLVRGFDTTYSIDSDNDGIGGIAVGEKPVTFLAYEKVGNGHVFAAGGVFLSDFEVKAELDNIWDLPYANRTIYENILNTLCLTETVTPIADTRKAPLGKLFVIEGYVTSGTQYEGTTFFDAIYVQDETGGTTAFPYADTGLKIGTKVRILGYTDAYQDDRELQIISLSVLDDAPHIYPAKVLTTEQAADYATYGGQYVETKGIVSEIVRVGEGNNKVSQFKLTDSTGVSVRIFIDGYIYNEAGKDPVSADIVEGMEVTAAGMSYMHPEGEGASVVVLRVRNMDDIRLGAVPEVPPTAEPTTPPSSQPTAEPTTPPSTEPTTPPSSEQPSQQPSAQPTDPPSTPTNPSPWYPSNPSSPTPSDTPASSTAPTAPASPSPSPSAPVEDLPDIDTPLAGLPFLETTIRPSSSMVDGVLTAEIQDSLQDAILDHVEANKSTTVVVAPAFDEKSAHNDVILPGALLDSLSDVGNVDVRVETPVGNVTIPEAALEQLGTAKQVTVCVQKSEGSVTVTVKADDKTLATIPGGVKTALQLEDGQVAVLVDKSGKETVLPKSIVEDGTTYAILPGSGTVKVVSRTALFQDVPATSWYVEAVSFAASHEIFSGVSESEMLFAPDLAVDRSMAATMLWALESKVNPKTTASFPDVATDKWYAASVAWASENGIVAGYSTGVFAPADTITREQFATMLYNYAKYLGLDTAHNNRMQSFSDADTVSSWAKDAMAWAVGKGIINGNGNQQLIPKDSITRAQAAAAMKNLVSLIVK